MHHHRLMYLVPHHGEQNVLFKLKINQSHIAAVAAASECAGIASGAMTLEFRFWNQLQTSHILQLAVLEMNCSYISWKSFVNFKILRRALQIFAVNALMHLSLLIFFSLKWVDVLVYNIPFLLHNFLNKARFICLSPLCCFL